MDDPLQVMMELQPGRAVKTLQRLVAFGSIASFMTLSLCAPTAWAHRAIALTSSSWFNTILGGWLASVSGLQLMSFPLRVALMWTLHNGNAHGHMAGARRQQLLDTLRLTLNSTSWRVTKWLGGLSQLLMLTGALLAMFVGTEGWTSTLAANEGMTEESVASAHLDAGLRRAVVLGTAALASRTLLAMLYFSCAFLAEGVGNSLAGTNPEQLKQRKEALRAQLRFDTWVSAQDVSSSLHACSVTPTSTPSSVPACGSEGEGEEEAPLIHSGTAASGCECGVVKGVCDVVRKSELKGVGACDSGGRGGKGGEELAPVATLVSTALVLPDVACPVCLEEFAPGDQMARLPCPNVIVAGQAGHAFHENCILSWLMRQARCPMCCHALDVE